jgi:hypothetical protein
MSWILDKIYGIDAETTRGQALDSAMDAQNRSLVDQGIWSQADYDRYLNNSAAQRANTYSGQEQAAFNEGLAEGYDNVTGGIKAAINFPGKFLWDSIPWWVWLGGLVAVLWWLGLIKKGVLAR